MGYVVTYKCPAQVMNIGIEQISKCFDNKQMCKVKFTKSSF